MSADDTNAAPIRPSVVEETIGERAAVLDDYTITVPAKAFTIAAVALAVMAGLIDTNEGRRLIGQPKWSQDQQINREAFARIMKNLGLTDLPMALAELGRLLQ